MSQSHTRRLSMAACAGMFVFGLANALLGAILPILSTRIPFDIAQSGLLFLILNFGVLLCVLGMGPLIDRTGMKWPMVAGPITVALCLVLLQLAASYSTLAATCFLLGLGGGALNAATNTLVADLHADVRHKNAALTFLGVFFGAGALLVPFGIGSLLNESGLAPILYSCAVLCLGAGLYPVQLVFPSPKYTAQMPGL
jgi:FHS family glucose/mannose:H+ symporter-like MFS transporter